MTPDEERCWLRVRRACLGAMLQAGGSAPAWAWQRAELTPPVARRVDEDSGPGCTGPSGSAAPRRSRRRPGPAF
jgi:hypothetical protein